MRTAARAYELRSRLNTVERLHPEAWYHFQVTGDARTKAYRQIVRTHAGDPVAATTSARS